MDAGSGIEIGIGEVVKISDLALRLRLEELGETKWIPKSLLADESEVTPDSVVGDSGEVIVAPWWAKKEGLV